MIKMNPATDSIAKPAEKHTETAFSCDMAQTYWQGRKAAVLSKMTAAGNSEELLKRYRDFMEGMKIHILSTLPQDDILRQQIALLFLQAERSAEILLIRGEPVLQAMNAPEAKLTWSQKLLKSSWPMYGLLGAGIASCLFSNLIAIPFFAASALLFSLREKNAAEETPRWTAVCGLRTEALEAHITRQAQLIDAHIQDLRALLEDASAPLPDLPLDQDVMTLCQRIWASASQAPSRDGTLDLVERVLERSELEWADYSEKTRRLYDVMPTHKDSRTIYPALVKKSDGTLVSRGQRLEHR